MWLVSVLRSSNGLKLGLLAKMSTRMLLEMERNLFGCEDILYLVCRELGISADWQTFAQLIGD